jgi:hypothetical protein
MTVALVIIIKTWTLPKHPIDEQSMDYCSALGHSPFLSSLREFHIYSGYNINLLFIMCMEMCSPTFYAAL